jgi:hypothetical protein
MAATTSRASVTIVPQSAPAGGVLITQPPQTATSFYKIAQNQPVTFGWNMTYVIVTPTHLTVSAVCDNGNTYPVGPTDGIIPGTASSVVWDIYSYQQNNPNKPLAQATYTLHIWDDRGPGAARRPGYLAENDQLKFALYTPQAYTPIASGMSPLAFRLLWRSNRASGWTCAACSGALSNATHPTFVSLMVTFFIIFFSGFHFLRSNARARN